MAAQLTQAGTITREQTFLPIRRFGVTRSTNIAKGEVVYLVPATGTVSRGIGAAGNNNLVKVVALGAANNTSTDTDATIDVPCAVRGHFVTVVADGAIASGQRVKLTTDSTKIGRVVAVANTDTAGVLGIYWAKEGGSIARPKATNYLELFSDKENWGQDPAADGDIIEVELF